MVQFQTSLLLLTQKQEIWHIISSEIQFYLVDFSQQFLVQLIPKIAHITLWK